jgi:hypothetical protein
VPTSGLRGWRSSSRQSRAGAIESEQRVRVDKPVVSSTVGGARSLGARYWLEVESFTRGLVRAHRRGETTELRILGRGPLLLRFAPPQLRASRSLVVCRYPIRGGLLAQRPAGAISFAQTGPPDAELRSAITGFFPALAARPGLPGWTGALYAHVQARLHVAISRRYFARLIAEAGR